MNTAETTETFERSDSLFSVIPTNQSILASPSKNLSLSPSRKINHGPSPNERNIEVFILSFTIRKFITS